MTLLTSWLSWLWMCWQIQQEHAYHQGLATLAQVLPDGGQIRESRSGVTWPYLAVTSLGCFL